MNISPIQVKVLTELQALQDLVIGLCLNNRDGDVWDFINEQSQQYENIVFKYCPNENLYIAWTTEEIETVIQDPYRLQKHYVAVA